ncbi:hydroxysqualene dehydroxylase HpnE [Roseateles amylovorans]|uniref:Hydroxysqualene dehydroxylase HpnE n=1 Tax=Roseateles amylovorans TaxID=2978473 RepID=A0ABY6AW60_9BURK|nr:hydroxysqualene dehydroxylase HpnE [Roseateles amylovorans]UXH77107.1 hydroxysqualene dehydroxylase HpnE [Roseateles amylovorans]
MSATAPGDAPRLAIVGGGWSGLAAAIEATSLGAAVTLFEMAPQRGGRARSLDGGSDALDNGQHILIGAYTETLGLMRRIGLAPDALLLRMPLRLRYPDRETLRLPPGPPLVAFTRGVLGCSAWSWRDRLGFMTASTRWMLNGFRCDPRLTVAALCASMPQAVRDDLIDPLCVAALNTPAAQASAQVFLRVLKDALFSGPGSADLLLPRRGLSALLPDPASDWLTSHGAQLLTQRVQQITIDEATRPRGPHRAGVQVDGAPFDAVILACTSVEAARLTRDLAPDWSATAAAFEFQPIITVYLRGDGARLPAPMVALRESSTEPAQFAFDLGQLDQQDGLFSLVISGAADWVAKGLEAAGAAALAQATRCFDWPQAPQIVRVLSEKRATFACTPGLQRPGDVIVPGVWAAGDYLDGPYPATLEGAVRSGLSAARSAMRHG